MPYLSYAVAASVVILLLIVSIRWSIRQGEIRGRAALEAEVSRLQERAALLETEQAQTTKLREQLETKAKEMTLLQVDQARLQQMVKEKSERAEELEEGEAQRQLYFKNELSDVEQRRVAERNAFDTDRQRLTAELVEVKQQLAVNAAQIQLSEDQRKQLLEKEAALTALRAEIQSLGESYARADRLNESHSNRLNELQAALQTVEADHRDTRETLNRSREENAKVLVTVDHLQQSLDKAKLDLQHRDARLAEQQAAFELSLAEKEKGTQLQQRAERAEGELIELRNRERETQSRLASIESELSAEKQQSEQKARLLMEAKEALTDQFKAIAGDILNQNTQQFTDLNQQRLGQLLDPLKAQLSIFQRKVEDVHLEETKQNADLKSHVDRLSALNQELSTEARNLTRALKGEAKVQGDWGEMILERVLNLAGLAEGIHYKAQESFHKADGGYSRPDVVLQLPDSKALVVDAKVSLKAYEAYASAETDQQRELHFKQHLDSMRTHVDTLSKKNYAALPGLNSLPFVVMFVPLEPAYGLAMSRDFSLWHDAWNQGVMLVAPTTLLFVVRMVAHLSQQENQTRNAQEIARHGAVLYDKFVAFADDMDKIGRSIEKAQDTYQSAISRLSGPKGLAAQADRLRALGVQPTKRLSGKHQASLGLNESEDPSFLPLDLPLRPQ